MKKWLAIGDSFTYIDANIDESGYRDLPWPEYTKYSFAPADEYPYPEGTAWMTYDGLHPSDEGCEIIAALLAAKMKELV